MPELRRAEIGVVMCLATADALDRLIAPGHGAIELRTAPDEILFVTDPATTPDVAREVADRIAAVQSDALVADVTDGWVAWTLAGTDARAAFAFVSAIPPPQPDSWVQGDVARVGAKVIGHDDGLTILVPAFHDQHLHEQLTRSIEVTT